MFNKIDEQRKMLCISKRALCEKMQMSVVQYNKLLNGDSGGVKKLKQICDYLGLTIKIEIQ